MRGEWTQLFGFLKRPSLPEQSDLRLRNGSVAILRMLSLDFAAMSLLLLVALVVVTIGIDIPETALAGLHLSWSLVFFVVVMAPLLEEIAFRGWLSGKPGHVLALVVIGVGGVAAAMLGASNTGQEASSGVALALMAAVLLAGILLFVLRKKPPMAWFQAIFPVLFWLSTLAFALIHLLNFGEDNWVILLPLVLPQFILGMLLGYLRVNYGLWTAIALHMIHNGLIISVVMAAGSAGGS